MGETLNMKVLGYSADQIKTKLDDLEAQRKTLVDLVGEQSKAAQDAARENAGRRRLSTTSTAPSLTR